MDFERLSRDTTVDLSHDAVSMQSSDGFWSSDGPASQRDSGQEYRRFFQVTSEQLFRNNVLFCSIERNPVVLALLSCVLGLYAVAMVIAVRVDQHDARKNSIVRLVDNKKSDQLRLLVAVETGFRRSAGTSAKVVSS